MAHRGDTKFNGAGGNALTRALGAIMSGSSAVISEAWRYRWISFSLALNTYVLVETHAPVWQYIAIPGCVIFAAWIGVQAAESWKAGRWAASVGAALLFIMTVFANIYVAVQAAALTHDATVAARSGQIEKTGQLNEQIQAASGELRNLRSVTAGETEGQIQAVIDRLEASPIFRDEKRSNRCANDSVAESRTHCDLIRSQKGRKAAAQRIAVLEEKLDKLQAKVWDGKTDTVAMTDADPGAKAMAELTGFSEKLIAAGFTGYLAVLLELIAAFAPAFCTPRKEPDEGSRNPASKGVPIRVAAKVGVGLRKAQQGAKVAGKVSKPSPAPVPTEPSDPFSTWVEAKTFRAEDGSASAAALKESFDAWADENDLPPITPTMMGRKLDAMGIGKKKVAGRMTYLGISLKAEAALRVAAG